MLTQQVVIERSKTLKGAIDVSKQHWQEIATASNADLKKTSKGLIGVQYCGLCQYYKKIRRKQYCLLCPYSCGPGTTWYAACIAYDNSNWELVREIAAQIVIELVKL